MSSAQTEHRAGARSLSYERAAGAAVAPLSPKAREATYRRHRPEQSVLYAIVEAHLETLLDDARRRSEHGFGYPRFVEQTFRRYIECGRLELGFCRVRCSGCGVERLLAFSCKRRGLCPSCEARRMADTAAHLCDRALPIVPYRQWVLSLPIAARLLLARDASLVSAVLRIVVRRIFAWQRRMARGMGIADGRCGAVTFVQRFGGAVNVNVHFHIVVPDGVFDVRPDGAVRFVPVLGPDDDEVRAICAQIARRVDALLHRRAERGDFDDEPCDASSATLSLALPPAARRRPDASWEHPRASPRRCAYVNGYSLHAQTSVDALDRTGLERLCRYGLRSAFSLRRLSLDDDGNAIYRLKRPWPDGRTHLRLEPLALLRRLALLIPPPRSHLVRYHGVLASASAVRSKIVPRASRRARSSTSSGCVPHSTDSGTPKAAPAAYADRDVVVTVGDLNPDAMPTLVGAPTDATLLALRQRRLDWAALLRRVFGIDVLRCPRCDGRLVVIAAISHPPVVTKILRHLGLPTAPPRCAPARAPPDVGLPFVH